jgi:hypothetical protein
MCNILFTVSACSSIGFFHLFFYSDPMPSTSSGGKGAKDKITENESSVHVLSNEQASFPAEERNMYHLQNI